MVIAATLVVSLAAALHVGFFVMESLAWTHPAVWKRFGLSSQADADITRPLAYNQGFYNLFLAVGAIVGVVFVAIGWNGAGVALVVFTMACMVAAAVVLVSTGRRYIGAALLQGTLPLIGLVLMLLA